MNDLNVQRLLRLQQICKSCVKCKLHTTRKNVVFGEGNLNPDIMFIGEGPGKDEDLTGRPFVGKSGQLLTKLIEKHLGLNRVDVYIANIVKCRPTRDMEGEKDRPPDDEEMTACAQYIMLQIAIIAPKIVITLGNTATKFLLQTDTGITKLHGIPVEKVYPYYVVPFYHPSYIERNGGESSSKMREAIEDIKIVKMLLEEKVKGA